MRILSLIMSAFIMVLVTLPCGDERDCDQNTKEKMATTSEHEDHDHHTETCSPFCICVCCSTSMCFQTLETYSLFNPEFQKDKAEYLLPFQSYDFHSIWQPPKIG